MSASWQCQFILTPIPDGDPTCSTRIASLSRTNCMLVLHSPALHVSNDRHQLLALALGLSDTRLETTPFLPPSTDILLLLFQSTQLDLYVCAQTAIFAYTCGVLGIEELPAADLTNPMLLRAPKFHVAPFPIATSIYCRGIETHLVCFGM